MASGTCFKHSLTKKKEHVTFGNEKKKTFLAEFPLALSGRRSGQQFPCHFFSFISRAHKTFFRASQPFLFCINFSEIHFHHNHGVKTDVLTPGCGNGSGSFRSPSCVSFYLSPLCSPASAWLDWRPRIRQCSNEMRWLRPAMAGFGLCPPTPAAGAPARPVTTHNASEEFVWELASSTIPAACSWTIRDEVDREVMEARSAGSAPGVLDLAPQAGQLCVHRAWADGMPV